MRHGRLSREQAIQIMGHEVVVRLDRENCHPTSRLQTDGDTVVEYAASVRGIARDDGEERVITAYYYATPEQELIMAESGDGGSIEWEIAGYEIA